VVTYSTVFRLKRVDAWIVYLSLLCCVYHRSQRRRDHLLDSLIHHVRQYLDAAKDVSTEGV
jgi:hypothetical protein